MFPSTLNAIGAIADVNAGNVPRQWRDSDARVNFAWDFGKNRYFDSYYLAGSTFASRAVYNGTAYGYTKVGNKCVQGKDN